MWGLNIYINILLIYNNYLSALIGGVEGIRTLGTVTCPHAFQACAFDRSATAPPIGLSATHTTMQVFLVIRATEISLLKFLFL
jgi:hypothetical protein